MLGTWQVPEYLLRKRLNHLFNYSSSHAGHPLHLTKPTGHHKRELGPRPSLKNGTRMGLPTVFLKTLPCTPSPLLRHHLPFQMSSSTSSSYFTLSFHFISIHLLILMMYTHMYKIHLLKVKGGKKP